MALHHRLITQTELSLPIQYLEISNSEKMFMSANGTKLFLFRVIYNSGLGDKADKSCLSSIMHLTQLLVFW